ncbi:MAG: alanine--tRNA ligase, partial [Planctomycetes bacterium]|nr:alanine--tRNA ligase [Planctomycetota bacterium]
MNLASDDIRNDFFSFFEQRGHTFVPSSPLLPADDPTLLFANAGMNQFKGVFLGTEQRPYSRAHNSQKCMRAGGKHNDLEDVGHDCYHLTFFEMLGNWSFGDYFKKEAIAWAWQLLTDVWSLPKERLYATVFGGAESEGLPIDTEAEQIWQEVTDIDPAHVLHGSRQDNFWEPGETGPCGPSSEIHIDLTDDASGSGLVNKGDPRVIELWNLVFMQFNRDAEGILTPLPAMHVDTGLGFERICMVLNGKKSIYSIDVLRSLIERIEALGNHRYGTSSGLADRYDTASSNDMADVACRVVADHVRALTFAIADGVIPSNEGRGYVLRRILRRAARYARQYLNIEGTFLASLVPAVVETMGRTFPEIRQRRQYVVETIDGEEHSFARTLDRGISLFERQAKKLTDAGSKE